MFRQVAKVAVVDFLLKALVVDTDLVLATEEPLAQEPLHW